MNDLQSRIEDAASWMAERGFLVLITEQGPFVRISDDKDIGGEDLIAYAAGLRASEAEAERS